MTTQTFKAWVPGAIKKTSPPTLFSNSIPLPIELQNMDLKDFATAPSVVAFFKEKKQEFVNMTPQQSKVESIKALEIINNKKPPYVGGSNSSTGSGGDLFIILGLVCMAISACFSFADGKADESRTDQFETVQVVVSKKIPKFFSKKDLSCILELQCIMPQICKKDVESNPILGYTFTENDKELHYCTSDKFTAMQQSYTDQPLFLQFINNHFKYGFTLGKDNFEKYKTSVKKSYQEHLQITKAKNMEYIDNLNAFFIYNNRQTEIGRAHV